MKAKIVIDPKIMFGKPVIAGTRIPVYMILDLFADGVTEEEILRDYYPHLTKDGIRAALRYGAKMLQNEEIRFFEKQDIPRYAAF